MAHTSMRQRVARRVSGGVLTAALLAACGGGEIFAILQIVTPLAGQWSAGGNESISFLTPDPDVQVLNAKVDVTAVVFSESGVCGDTLGNGVNVVGTVDNGKAALRLPDAPSDCIRGNFTSLIRFDAEAVGALASRSYLNSRVDVRMATGLWVSENGLLKLKFDGPSSVDNNSSDADNATGCDVSNSAAKVNFTGTMTGFNTATLARPAIAELRNPVGNALMFSAVTFVDGDTLTLRNALGQNLTLTRQPDPAPGTLCPV